MANTKFLSNVTHNGVLFKTGDVIEGQLTDVHNNLVSRGLVEETTDAPTHNSLEADASGRAKVTNPEIPTEPTQAQIEAENAQREVVLQQQQAATAKAAEQQVAASQPAAPAHQPTPAEIAAEASQIQ